MRGESLTMTSDDLRAEREAYLARQAKRDQENRAKAPPPLPEKPKWWGARYCDSCGRRLKFDKGWQACGCEAAPIT